MEIKKTKVTLRELKASEGKWLTQASEEVEERIFAESVYLGKDASQEDWQEVTNEYKETYEREHPTK